MTRSQRCVELRWKGGGQPRLRARGVPCDRRLLFERIQRCKASNAAMPVEDRDSVRCVRSLHVPVRAAFVRCAMLLTLLLLLLLLFALLTTFSCCPLRSACT